MERRTICNAIGTHAQHRTVWDRSLHASAKTYVYIWPWQRHYSQLSNAI